MILKTLREFELEEENRALRREVAMLRREPIPGIVAEETPPAQPAGWDEIGHELHRVALIDRTYEAHSRGWRTLLECRTPRLAPPGEPVRIYRAGYFIAAAAKMSDRDLAQVGADMHLQMLAKLHREFLGSPR